MSPHLNIEIESAERSLAFDLFETSQLAADDTRLTLGDGSTITYAGTLMRKAADMPELTRLVIDCVTAVGTGLVANWLYDKLKGRPAKLRINRTEVEITRDKIRIVVEQLENEER